MNLIVALLALIIYALAAASVAIVHWADHGPPAIDYGSPKDHEPTAIDHEPTVGHKQVYGYK